LGTKAVFITGASKGIGEACALHFARLGWLTFAGVRQEEDGQRLREEAGEARLLGLVFKTTSIISGNHPSELGWFI